MSPPVASHPTHRNAPAAGPARRVKLAVSAAVALHFFAILTTLVGTGNVRFPPPVLAAYLRHTKPIDAYLQSLFLTSPFRFFAPDPAPTNLLWFELSYADGNVRWVEVARREELPTRVSFDRHLSLAAFVGWSGVFPSADDPRRSIISEEGRVCIGSSVRYVVRAHPVASTGGSNAPVRSVKVYLVRHQVLQPYQISANWRPDDLRLYNQAYLGAYSPDGMRGDDPFRPDAIEIPFNSYILAYFLLEHGARAVRDVPKPERLQKLLAFHLPETWEHALSLHPELLDWISEGGTADGEAPSPEAVEHLQRRIEGALAGGDAPGAPAPSSAPNGTEPGR